MIPFLLVILVWAVAITTLPAPQVRRKFSRIKRRLPRRKTSFPDMGLVVTEVATRLRCGASPAQAWAQTLRRHNLGENTQLDSQGVPEVLGEIFSLNRLQRFRCRIPPAFFDSLPAVFAVCRLGNGSGAPVAEILDSCATSITEAAAAHSARQVALAGPVSSARILAALPLGGFLLGYAFGIDVLEFLFATRLGNLALLGGAGAEIAGILLVKKMVVQARHEDP